MKSKELQEWRKKKKGEVQKEAEELRRRLASLRVDLSMGKVKNIREIRKLKTSIAQLETIRRKANEAKS